MDASQLKTFADNLLDSITKLLSQHKEHKLTRLRSLDPAEWLNWRANFILVAKINNWSVDRQKLELGANLGGDAKTATRDVDLSLETDGVTVEAVLDRFEDRILPRCRRRFFETTVVEAIQGPEESIEEFHLRLRSYFTIAHPGDSAEDSERLITQFVNGLRDQWAQETILRMRPQTLKAAFKQAMDLQYTELRISKRHNHDN